MALLASPLLAPQLLAFPHSYEIELGAVNSVEPMSKDMLVAEVTRARARLSTSPLYLPSETRSIFLSDGGDVDTLMLDASE